MIPVLRKKNLRSMFDGGINPESPLSIFDRPITYTRVPSNAIIPLGFVVERLIGQGSRRVLYGIATSERKWTYDEAQAIVKDHAG